LPIIGAQAALLRSKDVRENAWVRSLLARSPRLKVAVSLANKTARIAWALMTKEKPTARQPRPQRELKAPRKGMLAREQA
jgi:transposase